MPSSALSHRPNWLLAPGIATGSPADGWLPLARTHLLILVGVTGVGKSTTLRNMRKQGLEFHVLPDRRALTDALIIATMQAEDGIAPAPISDRAQRFAYTRRFRAQYAGGMAHALTLLTIAPELQDQVLLFDGLRGENEIVAAAASLPNARFVMLDAPDIVRVMRLLGRKDGFDRMQSAADGNNPTADSADARANFFDADARALFTGCELDELYTLAISGAASAEDVRAKIKIVTEERRNYDPAATRAALEEHAGSRALVLNTATQSPRRSASTIAEHFARWFPAHTTAGDA